MRGVLLSPDANALLSRPENVVPAAASMLALRVAECHAERCRDGLRCVVVELRETEIDACSQEISKAHYA